ncbi:MAG TPA: peptidoglycan-binding domain-containing protein, partial [Terriglobales bacterium]|nr:peptidoglycan-binding domain-containing protein [Terriglobales bacterium]
SGALPDLSVRAAQLYLTYLGFDPGGIDGVAGQHTLAALAEFQNENGMTPTTIVDANCVAQLQDALTRAAVAV